MTDPFLANSVMTLASGGALAGTVLYGRWNRARSATTEYVASSLRFPRDLDPAQVTAFVTSLSGLLPARARRMMTMPVVIFETAADNSGITHHLIATASIHAFVTTQLRAAIPGVRITAMETMPKASYMVATELRLSTDQRSLEVRQPAAASASILASLQPLDVGEMAAIQWVITPAGPVAPVKRSSVRRTTPQTLIENLTTVIRDNEDTQALRIKQQAALFRATLRLGASAKTPERRRQLLARLLGPWHVANAPGVHLQQRLWPSVVVADRLARRMPAVVFHPSLFNTVELTALLAWPVGGPTVPGLWLGTARQLPVPPEIPSEGVVLASSNFAGSTRPIAVTPASLMTHAVVLGATGAGKSTLLGNAATQVMNMGLGLIVIEPHGDLVADVLDRVPPHRVRDVIVLDPTDTARPVGLNPLAASHGDRELAVEQVVALFHQLYASSWGPRSDDVLRAGLLTLAGASQQMTLAELPRLLADEGFRAPLVAQTDDTTLRTFWAWFDQLSAGERSAVIAPVMNKVRAFLMRRRLRAIVGQAEGIDLDAVLSEKRILLVPLPVGSMGEDAAALLGSLVVASLWMATLRRAALPMADRHPVVCVVDELAKFLHLPTDVGDLLAEARKLGLGLVLATQYLGQLPPKLRQGVLSNARSKVAFAAAADDARLLAREFGPYLGEEDLRHLGPYEVALMLAAGPTVATPTTGVALPPLPPTNRGAAARAFSRENYGRDLADVEADIAARQEGEQPTTGVRRRPRRQP